MHVSRGVSIPCILYAVGDNYLFNCSWFNWQSIKLINLALHHGSNPCSSIYILLIFLKNLKIIFFPSSSFSCTFFSLLTKFSINIYLKFLIKPSLQKEFLINKLRLTHLKFAS
ncbi:hypothetical protein RchiOBHm_Chr3g0483091 [Rosa chinensis]|uniref:Uncharacterized protein n=1 Tax=Rosa chinensis TaxID=74649 RepID=A0A2P6REE1_ROSCH|nr:hypothetical protein RchiOBHm_Chr3g0483091 [Rosa chinensis]